MIPASAPSVSLTVGHKKKIYSKPLDTKSCANFEILEDERERKM